MSSLTKSPNEHIVTCIKVDDSALKPNRCAGTTNRVNGGTRIAIASVNHETESREPLRLELDLLKKCGNQIIRHVVNRAESDVFQRLRCGALPSAREPR
jgi:hypothetical protein